MSKQKSKTTILLMALAGVAIFTTLQLISAIVQGAVIKKLRQDESESYYKEVVEEQEDLIRELYGRIQELEASKDEI